MQAGRGSSDTLQKAMLGWRRVGSEPGSVASSIVVSMPSVVGDDGWFVSSRLELLRAVGALGWLIAFWPVIVLPSARPAEMWWEKLLMMAGRTAVFDSSTPPMMARR